MPSFIPEEIIEEIRNSNDIVSIISEYIPLKKTGKNYQGLCPFHSEKTPSFTVSSDKQIFHCFGCGIGGNVFNFIMKYENISYPEAIKQLAIRANILIPADSKKDFSNEEFEEREILYKINNIAKEYFQKILLESSQGKEARDYLTQRGINKEIIEKFGLGYSLSSWDNLLIYLTKKGFSQKLLQKAGLIVSRDKGDGYYDRFRNRIIFPIFNIQGKVIGFGGRVLDDSKPKYMNSPETPIYNKSKSLYLLNQAKNEIQRLNQVIIVEGYFDALTPHGHKLNNVVATLGTSLTKEHMKIISRYSKNVVIVFDSDPAGIKAAQRGLEFLFDTDLSIKVVVLPPKHDPDLFIRKEGPKPFLQIVEKAIHIIDFNIDQIINQIDLSNVDGKIEVLNAILPILAKIKNRVKQSFYVKNLAERLDLDEKLILQELKKHVFHKTAIGQESLAASLKSTGKTLAEQEILRIMLNNQDLIEYTYNRLKPDDFEDPILREISSYLFTFFKQKISCNLIQQLHLIQNEKINQIVSELTLEEKEYEDEKKTLTDCIHLLKTQKIKENLKYIQKEIREAEKRGEKETITQLLLKKQKIITQRRANSL